MEKLGFGKSKTYKELHLPKLNDELMRHFLRGYFDGDGSITGYLRKPTDKKHPNYGIRRSVIFTSKTRSLLEDILNYLNKYNIIKFNICKSSRNCYILNIADSEIVKLFHLLYDDSNFYLKRKYEKFNHLVNTEVTQLIAEYRNAQELKASNTDNTPKSVEHPIGMNMCAELIGNYENSEIKNSEDNKIEGSQKF